MQQSIRIGKRFKAGHWLIIVFKYIAGDVKDINRMLVKRISSGRWMEIKGRLGYIAKKLKDKLPEGVVKLVKETSGLSSGVGKDVITKFREEPEKIVADVLGERYAPSKEKG